MASQNKINLIKIKNHLQNKNFKIGGFLNFKSDASEKIFKLCKTANQSLLVLSFLNKPSDYKKYIKATDILISQNVNTPKIIDQSNLYKFVIMDYFPISNASKYFQKPQIKKILPLAVRALTNLQKPKKKFSGVLVKSQNNLLKDALKGIETFIDHYDHKIQIGLYLNKLVKVSLIKSTKKYRKFKPTLTHGDFFLDNLIYYNQKVYVIDHQDTHYNHPLLDISSLIFDARRSYSTNVEDKLLKLYARRMKLNLKELRSDIHMISLLRNLRILGNWVQLYNGGKPKYLKVFRKNTWAQIFKHVEYLRLWDLREIFIEIYNKTS